MVIGQLHVLKVYYNESENNLFVIQLMLFVEKKFYLRKVLIENVPCDLRTRLHYKHKIIKHLHHISHHI